MHRPHSGNLDQHPSGTDSSGDARVVRCYFAEDDLKPHAHSASVFKTVRQAKGTHASRRHTTTGDSTSDLFAQLVRSQFVPEQKPQTFGSQIRRAIDAARRESPKLAITATIILFGLANSNG